MFGVLMYYLPPVQQTSIVKLLVFFLSFQTKEPVLMVNKIKISGKHAFQRDLLKTEDNHESRKGEKLGF